MKDTTQSNRLILAILAVIVGLLMIAVAPFLIQTSLERVISALQILSAEKPAYAEWYPVILLCFSAIPRLDLHWWDYSPVAGTPHLSG